METASSCPKCGSRRESGWDECPFCGVVYAKAAAGRSTASAVVAGDSWPGPAPAAAWGSAAPAPATAPANLYRPPSAPAAESLWQRPRTAAALAGRGTRLAAQVVDTLCVVPIAVIAAFLIPDLTATGGETGLAVGIVVAGIGLLALIVTQLVLLARHGQTIGKRALGIRIVRLDGARASLGRLFFLRMVAPSILGAVPYLYLGTLFSLVDTLFIFRGDRRCLHDHMADTQVVVA